MKEKTLILPISKFINSRFREYALYVISSRGIPSFYDGLTPVQRYIIANSPRDFVKTLTVVGKAIEAGYHHGNNSLESSISRLARPFGNALQLLEGSGFFGTEVCPEPSAARYTGVRLSKTAGDIIGTYKHLNTKRPEEGYDPFWMDIPIGLTNPIAGIAVGYRSLILPRKPEHIREYLDGKRKSLKPHFNGFNGKIKKHKGNSPSNWMVSAEMNTNGKKIEIRGIPPLLKYSSVLKRLDTLMKNYEGEIRIVNNSNTSVIIDVNYLGKSVERFKEIEEYVYKTFSIIVSENIVFVKDDQVLVYDTVEEYLEDFKWQRKRLFQQDVEYRLNVTTEELEFNIAKEEFISFVLQKKRTVEEIDIFLNKKKDAISKRLESLTSKKFTSSELLKTREEIQKLQALLKDLKVELKKKTREFEKMEDPTEKRGIRSVATTIDLFDTDDVTEEDDVVIWNGEDPYDKEEETDI